MKRRLTDRLVRHRLLPKDQGFPHAHLNHDCVEFFGNPHGPREADGQECGGKTSAGFVDKRRPPVHQT